MNSRKIPSSIIFIISLLVAAFLGCVAGNQYSIHTLQSRDEWQLLGKPPEPIKRFHSVDFHTVFVETESGKLFSCYYITPYDNNCWVEIEQLPEPEFGFYHSEIIDRPDYPGPVVDSIARWYASRFDFSAKYVLLPNGNVMQYLDGGGLLNAPNLARKMFLNLCSGSLMGIIGWFIIFLAIKHYRQVKSHPVMNDKAE